jgi:hypothetical protein
MPILAARRSPPRQGTTVAGATLAALALLAAAGCDGSSSPTAPDLPSGTVDVVFDDPTGALSAHAPLIRQLLASTFDRVAQQLSVGGTTFTVTATAAGTVAGWGLGGFTLGPANIEIPIDPTYPGLEIVLAERLPPIAAHELHHVARMRGVFGDDTLLDALVREGLADRFAIELLGSAVPPWANALSPSEIEHYQQLAEAELDELNDYGRWFLGADPQIPLWTGYTIGFHLVGDHMARTGQSAAQLVHTPASDFLPR